MGDGAGILIQLPDALYREEMAAQGVELPLYAEWAIRLPFAALAIAAVGLLSHAVSKRAGKTAGLATGFVLATMPLFFFIARQAMTDMPFVAAITIAWACALLGGRAWWGFYAAMGVATLGKGLLGGLPAVCFAGWWLVAGTAPAGCRELRGQPVSLWTCGSVQSHHRGV